jgi:sucrose-phosphate synthase
LNVVLQVIDSMAPGSAKVLDQVLKLIDAYDLYGSVAYPKRHTQDDISDIYLLPAATRGVFVNIALQVSVTVPMLPAQRLFLEGACDCLATYSSA